MGFYSGPPLPPPPPRHPTGFEEAKWPTPLTGLFPANAVAFSGSLMAWRLKKAVMHVPDQPRHLANFLLLAVQNRKNTSARLELKKYNKYLRRMTVHREIK